MACVSLFTSCTRLSHWFDSKAWSPQASWPYAAPVGDTILLAYDLGVRWLCQNKHGAWTPRETVCSRMCDFCGISAGVIWPPFVTSDHVEHIHSEYVINAHARIHIHTHPHTLCPGYSSGTDCAVGTELVSIYHVISFYFCICFTLDGFRLCKGILFN